MKNTLKIFKLIIGFTSLFLMGLTSAQADDGWYGKLNIGYSSPKSLDVTGDFAGIAIVPAPALPTAFDYKAGVSFGGAIGYQVSMLRLEGEFSINSLDYDILDDLGGITRTEGKSNSFALNGYLDFDMDSVIQPFIGGGLGYNNATLGAFKDKYFSMQGMVGFAYSVNENFVIGVEYRYSTSISGAQYDTMASHNGILSLRANF